MIKWKVVPFTKPTTLIKPLHHIRIDLGISGSKVKHLISRSRFLNVLLYINLEGNRISWMNLLRCWANNRAIQAFLIMVRFCFSLEIWRQEWQKWSSKPLKGVYIGFLWAYVTWSHLGFRLLKLAYMGPNWLISLIGLWLNN